jgi:hypothetical protein
MEQGSARERRVQAIAATASANRAGEKAARKRAKGGGVMSAVCCLMTCGPVTAVVGGVFIGHWVVVKADHREMVGDYNRQVEAWSEPASLERQAFERAHFLVRLTPPPQTRWPAEAEWPAGAAPARRFPADLSLSHAADPEAYWLKGLGELAEFEPLRHVLPPPPGAAPPANASGLWLRAAFDPAAQLAISIELAPGAADTHAGFAASASNHGGGAAHAGDVGRLVSVPLFRTVAEKQQTAYACRRAFGHLDVFSGACTMHQR